MHELVKKGFLQACINHGSLTSEKINDILTPLCEAYEVEVPTTAAEVNDFVEELNSELRNFSQALTFIQHPLVGKQYLVFGLTTEHKVSKQQPHYSNADRYYFAKLLEKMVNKPEYCLHWNELYSFEDSSAALQKQLSKSRMQLLVQKWTAQGYFLEKDELLYFGPRMLVEYSSYLKMHFADVVQDCPLCGNLVFWDVQCSECDTRMHRECIRKYLARMSTCPSCSKTWNTRLSLSQ